MHHSMLMFIRLSFVATIPCTLTRFAPAIPFPLTLPPLPLRSPTPCPFVFGGGWPHAFSAVVSTGLCGRTGLLCTLIPGLTARRLKLAGSKSSSRRRFLLTLRARSLAVGNVVAGPASGVEEREWEREEDLVREVVVVVESAEAP